MSALELLVDNVDGRLHAAVVHKTVLSDLYVDPLDYSAAWDSIYLGMVAKIDKSLDAAIIDLGGGLSGLLPAKHVHFPGANRSETRTGIADLLKPGQTLIVQIKSEGGSGKLPRLTSNINIMGQHLIYCPVASQVTISRQLKSEPLIALTAKLKGKGGWIVQPAAETTSEEEIHAATLQLQEDWHGILAERQDGGDQPRLLKTGPNALVRALFDHGEKSFAHIHVGNKHILEMMMAWCEKNAPALATSKRLRLFKPEAPSQKLFDLHDLYAELETLNDKTVALPSGGSLVIEPVEAFTVIDVNQGSSRNIIEANMEAVHEIARQIRLRNLSGAILIDFIGQAHKTDRDRVIEALEKRFADDPAAPQVHGFTRLGIAEVTRKRRTATNSHTRA